MANGEGKVLLPSVMAPFYIVFRNVQLRCKWLKRRMVTRATQVVLNAFVHCPPSILGLRPDPDHCLHPFTDGWGEVIVIEAR